MEKMVERITKAARHNDTREIERIVHELVVIGACDETRARAILGYARP
jgi:hypothetical protein